MLPPALRKIGHTSLWLQCVLVSGTRFPIHLKEAFAMNINELDVVRLTDGREGTVVEVYGAGEAFEIEFLDGTGEPVPSAVDS